MHTPTRLRASRVAAFCVLAACSGAPAPQSAAFERPTVREATPLPDVVADPSERAEAGGWSTQGLEPPPFYCNDQGGREWCDGTQDDDCDGLVDEGCADCANQKCERYPISAEKMKGASRVGTGECVGPIYCGRIDGYASTTPPGGCGAHSCATTIFPDGTARPNSCTIFGRCADGVFEAKGFSW